MYTAPANMTLDQVAKATGTDKKRLKKYNPTLKSSSLNPGEAVLLPPLEKRPTDAPSKTCALAGRGALFVLGDRGAFFSPGVPPALSPCLTHCIQEVSDDKRGRLYIPYASQGEAVKLLCFSNRSASLDIQDLTNAPLKRSGWNGCIWRENLLNRYEHFSHLRSTLHRHGLLSCISLPLKYLCSHFPYESIPHICDGIILECTEEATLSPCLDVLGDLASGSVRPYLWIGLPPEWGRRAFAFRGGSSIEKALPKMERVLDQIAYGGYGGILVPKGGTAPEFYGLFRSYFTPQRGYETEPPHSLQ